MVITNQTASVAKGLDNIACANYITMPKADYVLQQVATKARFAQYKNKADRYRIMKLERLAITPNMLKAANVAMGDDYRPVEMNIKSIEVVQTLHPATITIATELIDQSILALENIAAKVLSAYALDVREIKAGAMLQKSATSYNCQYGANGLSPTELTVKDLNEVSSKLRNRGMVPVFGQYLASVGINTSGIPKSYMFIGSEGVISNALNSIDAANLNSFKSNFQYSGAANYSQNVRGIEASSGICFISSNNFSIANSINTRNSGLVISGDSFIMSLDTPTSDAIIYRDPLVSSPTGLKRDISVRCPFMGAVTRPEGVIQMNFTNKS